MQRKILFLFVICTSFLIAAAAFGFWRFSLSLRLFDQDVVSSQINAVDVVTAEADFKKQVQEWKDALLRGKQPEALDKHWKAFQQREGDVQRMTDRLARSVADPQAAQLLAQFQSAHRSMGEAYRRGLQEYKGHDFDSAAGDKAVAGIDRAPTELLTKARERLLSLAGTQAAEAREFGRRTTWMALLLFAAATAAGAAVFLVFVQRNISRPLTKVMDALDELARGNFAVGLPGLERKDEIGGIARAVKAFGVEAERRAREEHEVQARQEQIAAAQRRSDTIRLADQFEKTVGEVIETFSSASAGLETSAGTLTATAQRAQELTRAVATASEQASANVHSVASATEALSSSIIEISGQVQQSARIANDAVDQARTTTERIGELSKTAARIGDVLDLINTIAGQTNLLALNATIEAARAGDAGRGFAVVASEVKGLAEQTAKATGEIGKQITGIQTATQESVGAIQQISGTIGKLSEIASAIAAAVEEQGAATQEISGNVQQAAQGTQQVSSNITDVQRGAAETGSASSMVLSAVQALSSDADRLKLELGKFLDSVRAA